MSSKIDQIIEEIEDYIESCKFQPLSSTKIIVNKEEIVELIAELRQRTPEEVKRYQKMISNIVEVKARGAFVMAVTGEDNREIEKAADYVIYIPEANPYFANSLAIIPLQLFGYYVAVGKGCDVDKPRNLAKSVTVE